MSKPQLATRERLSEVRYEIRGELARRARELEAQGHALIKLNIGNPGAFGFRAPEHMQRAIADHIHDTDPYAHQQGLPDAREAIAAPHAARGFDDHAFALELMETEHVLVVPGSSFNVPYRNHFRVTLLPEPEQLREVFRRIDRVLARRAAATTASVAAVAPVGAATAAIAS